MQHWLALQLICLLCLPTGAGAEELEPLDVEFLEYLASFEDDDEDWTLFADEERIERRHPELDAAPGRKRELTQDAAKPAADHP